MVKKLIAWVTLAAFLIFSWSCVIYRWGPKKLGSVKPESRGNAKICAVQLKSGRKIEFSKSPAARIQGDSVAGKTLDMLTLAKSAVKKPRSFWRDTRYPEIITEDGTVYRDCVISKVRKKDIVIRRSIQLSVPLAEIDLLWVKKVDALGMTLLYVIPVGVGIALVAIAASGIGPLMPDLSGISSGFSGCCLLVYSDDGAGLACDAEPFAGAIAQGLERTDWLRLDHWREMDGHYRLLGSNSLEETQFLDELKLVAVDHAAGARVVPDMKGRFHTVSQPIPPQLATDSNGADITRLLAGDDEVLWTGGLEGKDPAQAGRPKEELTLEFPRPAGANKVKIVADARTTLLGSFSVKKFLELYGQALPAWYKDVDQHGPSYNLIQDWLLNEELYRLHIRVQTKDGWASKGVIYAGGPFVSKEKAYPLDISDVQGDVLKVKLTPAAGFWLIDSVIADYSADLPLQARELAANKAADACGRDIRDDIARTDQKYFIMPVTGDTAEFVFDAPPVAAGLERTLLLKASGYYEAHLSAAGVPRWDIITKFISEPGFAVRYAWNEFERWAVPLETLSRAEGR